MNSFLGLSVFIIFEYFATRKFIFREVQSCKDFTFHRFEIIDVLLMKKNFMREFL